MLGDAHAVYTLLKPMRLVLSFFDSDAQTSHPVKTIVRILKVCAPLSEICEGPYTLVFPCDEHGKTYSSSLRILKGFASLNCGVPQILALYTSKMELVRSRQ